VADILHSDPFHDLPTIKIAQLGEVQEALRACAPPALHRFTLDARHLDRQSGDWQDLLHEVTAAAPKGNYTLYYLQLADPDAAESVMSLFRHAHEPKLGLPRDNKRISPVLYVGSSLKMGTRLREHLGFCSDKTYALKLCKWYPAADIPVGIELRRLSGRHAPPRPPGT
jgi:hypothetical protein